MQGKINVRNDKHICQMSDTILKKSHLVVMAVFGCALAPEEKIGKLSSLWPFCIFSGEIVFIHEIIVEPKIKSI